MADWRFWKSRSRRVDYGDDIELPALDDAAAEGFAMAKQAAVMALKNRILVSAHTAPEEFQVSEFVEVARDIVRGLAMEEEETAERSRNDRRNAALLKGDAIHQHDYRRDDVGALELRSETFDEVASRLRAAADDDERMRSIVIRARDQAWAELAREMERSLDRAELIEFGDENYAAERDNRLREFVTVDLFKLQMKAQRDQHAMANTDESSDY